MFLELCYSLILPAPPEKRALLLQVCKEAVWVRGWGSRCERLELPGPCSSLSVLSLSPCADLGVLTEGPHLHSSKDRGPGLALLARSCY